MSCAEPAISRRAVARSGLCIGCGACLDGAEPGARMMLDGDGLYRPDGPRRWLRRPNGALARICPFSPHAEDETRIAARLYPGAQRDPRIGRFEAAYVGAAAEGGFREAGSSGGMVSWVAAELLRSGRVDAVAHVAPCPEASGEAPRFAYRVARNIAALRAGARSRYYPVELSGVLREMRTTPGRYAVIGLPCFIKALRLVSAEDPLIDHRLAFTLGLFCGHMKSARLAESFAWQMGAAWDEVRRVEHRIKDARQPANWYVAEVELANGETRSRHWWDMADGDWGAGFFQSPACDACDDVVAETADVSFGDAWVEPHASDGRGTNVVVARSPEIARMIEAGRAEGRLDLAPVDAGYIERTQAAGFRQRREGLGYRLTWRRRGLPWVKRVPPSAKGLPLRRRLIYRMRHGVSVWSHRMFRTSRWLGMPRLYLAWARLALGLYQGLAYSRGPVGRLIDRLLPKQP